MESSGQTPTPPPGARMPPSGDYDYPLTFSVDYPGTRSPRPIRRRRRWPRPVADEVPVVRRGDAVRERCAGDTRPPAREEAYFAGAVSTTTSSAMPSLRTSEAGHKREPDTPTRRGAPRARHDIRARLMDLCDAQLHALRQLVCHLLFRHYRELIAYGAGWTDPERQRPVGDTGRHEPRHPDAIVADELQRALADPAPMRGISQLTARLDAAFTLDPTASPAPRRSGQIGSRASSATPSPAARARCGQASGSSCGQCSRPRCSPSTATLSSSINESTRPSTSMHTERPRVSRR